MCVVAVASHACHYALAPVVSHACSCDVLLQTTLLILLIPLQCAAGGRYLPDVWQLNLETLSWTDITTAFQKVPADPIEDEAGPSNGDASQAPATTVSSSFPASAAGVAIPHRGRALLVGGHSKDQKADPTSTLVVRVLDPARHTWGVLPCTGEVPAARGGHAAALIGDKVYVFGGEGARLRLQTGVTVLDLMTNEWSTLPLPTDARSAPEPRSSLVATSYQDRCVLAAKPQLLFSAD